MSAFTLESGPCPLCQTENSKHIDQCHSCGVVLPWSGEESKRIAALAIEEANRKDTPIWLRALLVTTGGLLVLVGVFLYFGQLLCFYRTAPLLGYVILLVGVAIFKKGNDMS